MLRSALHDGGLMTHGRSFLLSVLAFPVVLGCHGAGTPAAATAASTSPEPVPQVPSSQVPVELDEIRIDGKVLTFAPTRDDFSVAKAVFSIHCSEPSEILLNGKSPGVWTYIDLPRVGPNRFALQPLTIRFLRDERPLTCLSVKVWFEQVDNVYDGLFYENLEDRYALRAYCTHASGPGWKAARPRFGQNRVATLRQFQDALGSPFVLRLNERSLAEVEEMRRVDEARH